MSEKTSNNKLGVFSFFYERREKAVIKVAPMPIITSEMKQNERKIHLVTLRAREVGRSLPDKKKNRMKLRFEEVTLTSYLKQLFDKHRGIPNLVVGLDMENGVCMYINVAKIWVSENELVYDLILKCRTKEEVSSVFEWFNKNKICRKAERINRNV